MSTNPAIARSFLLALLFAAVPAPSPADAAEPAGLNLPEPFATKSTIHHPKVIGWPTDKTPQAPQGFKVRPLATELDNPRWLYVLPNGDILVAQARTLPKPPKLEEVTPESAAKKKQMAAGLKESKTVTGDSPNQITLLRDANGDGQCEVRETFLAGLNQPFGMALVHNTLYVATTDALLAFPYQAGQVKLQGHGMKILDLPAGGYNNHWTRNVVANADGTKLYVSVGSASNVAEHGTAEEMLRANILEINPDGTGLRVFASGLRNPVGMDWQPTSGKLWTAVNERDELGDELVPDYLTSVQEGGFYGWPFAYFGQHPDPRLNGERADLVLKSIVPDVPLGAHTASLGLAFYDGKMFPASFQGGAFVGQRGSWNRSKFAGYRVAFVPFREGLPNGEPRDFLTGFIANENEVYGRPVGVAVAGDGSLLVADEPSDVVWRVSYESRP